MNTLTSCLRACVGVFGVLTTDGSHATRALGVLWQRSVGGAIFDRQGRTIAFTSDVSVDDEVHLLSEKGDAEWVWRAQWMTTSIAKVLPVPPQDAAASDAGAPPPPLLVLVDTAGGVHLFDEDGTKRAAVVHALKLSPNQLASLRTPDAALLADKRVVVCGTVGPSEEAAGVQCAATRPLW